MKNKIIIALVFSLFIFKSPAQTNLSVDNDCLRKNAATLSQVLINLKGKEFVSNLLESKTHFILFGNVDSSGIIVDIKRVRSNKEFSKELEEEIISYLKSNHVFLYLCYEKAPGLTEKESYDLIKKNLSHENKTTYWINLSFPGDLMSRYLYEKDKAKEQGVCLSRYEYLLSMINMYKTQFQ